MLLHEHGGQADEHHRQGHEDLLRYAVLSPGVPGHEQKPQGTYYVKRRTDVGGSIHQIYKSHYLGKYILSREYLRPEFQTAWIHQIDDHCHRKGQYEELHQVPEVVRLVHQSVYEHDGDQRMPGQIRQHEILTKRYHVIYKAVDHVMLSVAE